MATQGGWWIWTTVLETHFPTKEPIDWTSKYFGRTFALYVLLGANFQCIYLFLYFTCKNGESVVGKELMIAAKTPEDGVRVAGLLRAVESAVSGIGRWLLCFWYTAAFRENGCRKTAASL